MVGDSKVSVSRRGLLAGGAAVAAASAFPVMPAKAQPRARWRRYNVASPEGQAMMVHYANGIRAMLKLPPSHPCNWYRAGFTHFLDCPHGNWWILPWHRAFTGWLEQTVRKYSGFDGFAFPYWDWTANPQIPAIMMDKNKDNVLNPNADAFIGKSDNFQRAFKKAINDAGYWYPRSPQFLQLQLRDGCQDPDTMWDQILNPPTGPAFFEQPNTRNPSPNLDCVTGPAVSAPTLKRALAPQDFMTFGSPSAAHHSDHVGSGVLEGYPHNKIHNNTGGIIYSVVGGVCDLKNPYIGQGFMQWNLSPVDPLFFLHHSNLDRLWDAWTRSRGEDQFQLLPPAGPPYYYYEHWAAEPFLFFYGPDGNPVAKNRAGDYAQIGDFNYDYQPGTGDPGTTLRSALRASPRPPVRRFAPEISATANTSPLVGATPALAVRATPAFLQATRAPGVQAVFAKVTVTLPSHGRGQVFRVLVHTGKPDQSIEAGAISLFGQHGVHSGQGAGTFVIPIDDALAELRQKGLLKTNALLYFRVETPPDAGPHVAALPSVPAQRDLPVDNVVIEIH